MPSLPRRALVSFTLALAAFAAAIDWLLLAARGSRAPTWAHWWCSASGQHASAQHGGQAAGGLAATLIAPVRALVPHWPHILPIVVALATLIYLWRANTRYHAHKGALLVEPADPSM